MSCSLAKLYVFRLPEATVVNPSRPKDLDKDDDIPEGYTLAPPEQVQALAKQQASDRRRGEKVRTKKLGEQGFEVEHAGEVLF